MYFFTLLWAKRSPLMNKYLYSHYQQGTGAYMTRENKRANVRDCCYYKYTHE
jgi:hypothetical protein